MHDTLTRGGEDRGGVGVRHRELMPRILAQASDTTPAQRDSPTPQCGMGLRDPPVQAKRCVTS
ncbi:hypothetical protein GCM10009668_03230 [Nocardioides dubius]|uniref:Uncharacterized protein n=1 Tax=Nocardioides dubius TaxID=317019 RepID=A0ABN1TMZ3_9ACTN